LHFMRIFIGLILSFLLSFSIFAQEKNSVFDVARKGTLKEIKKIYKKDPKAIVALNENGFSPLILATYKNNNEVAKFLIEKGAKIDEVSEMGTPLMAAVVKGNLEIVKFLIEKKANINLSDSKGNTALIYAVQFQNLEIVKLLLQNNVDKTKIDKQGKTAFEYAVFAKNEEIINLLK
jgi:uncharacterized protein